jgi:hypothetical protein
MSMIEKGFCLGCGRRLDEDQDRPNDGVRHLDCARHDVLNILKNLGVGKDELVKILNDQGILTTDEYWDCECLNNYIHPKNQKTCFKCCTKADEQPDSRVSEVLAAGFLLRDGS